MKFNNITAPTKIFVLLTLPLCIMFVLLLRAVYQDSELNASIIGTNIPSSVITGGTIPCSIFFQNDGEKWVDNIQYVALGLSEPKGWHRHLPPTNFQLLRPDGTSELADSSDRVKLPMPWNHGKGIEIHFLLRAIGPKGIYTIQLQLVKEGVRWFGESRQFEITIK